MTDLILLFSGAFIVFQLVCLNMALHNVADAIRERKP